MVLFGKDPNILVPGVPVEVSKIKLQQAKATFISFFNRLSGRFDFEPSKPERMLLHKELTFEKLYK